MARPTGLELNQIEAMIVERIWQGCLDACKDDISEDDPSRADHVIIGKPTDELADETVVSVFPQHPFGEREDADEQMTGLIPGPYSGGPYNFPAETIGGMRVDKMIGAVQINCRLDLPASEAVWINAVIKQRVANVINQSVLLEHGIEDDMGNFLWHIETFRSFGYDGGGGEVSTHTRWVGFRAYIAYRNDRPS